MKKMNYPKVIFRPYINDNKEWKILPYVILSDVISNNISEFQNIHQIPYDEIVA